MSGEHLLPGRTERDSWATLRRFTRRVSPADVSAERCDVCGTGLLDDHTHLIEPASRQLICVCDECMVSVGSQMGTPYRRVPRRIRYVPDFQIDDALWDSFLIPVGMAFFFHSTPSGRVIAFYPSPAGATESLLNLEAWEEVVRANPLLATMEPDVEALLVNRLKGAREYFLVPVDKCYELVGLIRMHWRGLAGGSAVWDEIERFYEGLRERARRMGTYPLDEGRA